MTQLFANNAQSTLASSVNSSTTTLPLAAGTGASFPSPSGGDFFMLTLTQPGIESSWEIVKVTARSTDSLTVVRAQEGTSAASWASGSKAELRLTAGAKWSLSNIDQSISPTWTGNHVFSPASGDIVITAGNFGVGTSAPIAKTHINNNSTPTNVVPVANTLLHLSGANSASNLFVFDSFAGIPAIWLRRAQGTSASKSAVQANQNLFLIEGQGYGATAYGGTVSAIRSQASESFTDTAQGARLTFHTTPVGTTTLFERVRIDQDGSVKVVADNQELQLGAGQDLRLYHDGTDSYIENDTGNLVLKVNGDLALSEVSTTTTAPSAGGAGALPATPDGYVTVIVNGTAKKLPFYPA